LNFELRVYIQRILKKIALRSN